MTTKTDIIDAVKAVADAIYANLSIDEADRQAIKIAVGSEGTVIVVGGRRMQSGSSWAPEPKVFSVLVEGLADYLDNAGMGQIPAIVAKINELIGEYNQLLSDHNSGIVPSAANPVVPL